ncbi:MAG: hypothetical protein F7B20_01460 [Aeropyrum sp.]|nr:hypothetical protein [Aeropyrum sp.]MCE4616834.1 hypothetical protein [Aeropyrum sp.]
MSASGYAKVVPYIRAVLSTIPKPESYREAIEASSLGEAVAAVTSPSLESAREAGDIFEVGRLVWRDYTLIVNKASKLSPAKARMAVELNLLFEDLKDTLSFIFSALRGSVRLGELEKMPTSMVEGSTINNIIKSGPEAFESLSRIPEASPKPSLRRVYSQILQLVEGASPPLALLSTGPAMSWLLKEAVSSLGGEAMLVEKVYCPRVLYSLLSGVIQAKASAMDAKSVDTVYSGVEVCGFSWDKGVRQIYESEASAEGLSASLSQLYPDFRMEGSSIGELLESLRMKSRAKSLEAGQVALASYPFQAGFVAGGLEIVRIAFEDIAYVLAASQLKVGKEAALARTSPTR